MCRYPELVKGLVVLDSSPERPRRQASGVGGLLSLLLQLDLDTLTSRREADRQLEEKIPVSPAHFLHISHSHNTHTHPPLSCKESLSKRFPADQPPSRRGDWENEVESQSRSPAEDAPSSLNVSRYGRSLVPRPRPLSGWCQLRRHRVGGARVL